MAEETNWKHIPEEDDLASLKSRLQKYRELLLPLSNVLEWEQKHYPAILVSVITIAFASIWYLEPSVLSSICMLGIVVSVVDYAVPTLLSHFYTSAEWTSVQENQFETICRRLVHAKKHFVVAKDYLSNMKTNKPKMYLVVMMVAFALIAWLGSLIDNLLLTYLIVIGLSLTPGLRKHGILQLAIDRVKDLRKSKSS